VCKRILHRNPRNFKVGFENDLEAKYPVPDFRTGVRKDQAS